MVNFLGWGPDAENKPRSVTFSNQVFQNNEVLKNATNVANNLDVIPLYLTPIDDDVSTFIAPLEPLAISGRIIIRPQPAIAVLTQEVAETGGRTFHLINVAADSPLESWVIPETIAQSSIPLKSGPSEQSHELDKADFVLPFIGGIPLPDLAKLLDDEEHNLSEMRAGIVTLIRSVDKGDTNACDVLNDVLRPAVGKVERRFRQITNMHRVKVGGAALGTVCLSLASLTAQGILASLSPFVGAGGLGLVAKEYADYMKAKGELSDMPHYLLWRLSKLTSN
jgi:hypothetical protein